MWASEISPGRGPGAAADQRHAAGGMVRRPERPLAPALGFQRLAAHRADGRGFQRLGLVEHGQDAGQARGQQRLAGAGRPDHQQVVPAGRGNLQRPPGAGLAADVLHVGHVGDAAGLDQCRHVQLGAPGQRRAHACKIIGQPAIGIADQPGLGRVGARQHQAAPGIARVQDSRQAARHTLHLAGQRQFAQELVLIEHPGLELIRGDQNTQRDRQIEAAAVLRQIGRRQRHCDAPRRRRETGIGDRGAHPVARFAHRRIGQADDIEARQPAGQVHLDAHRRGGNAELGAGMDDGEVHGAFP